MKQTKRKEKKINNNKILCEYRADDIDRKIKRLEIKKDTYKRLYE